MPEVITPGAIISFLEHIKLKMNKVIHSKNTKIITNLFYMVLIYNVKVM